MTISYPLDLLTLPSPNHVQLIQQSIVGINESPFTFAQQVQDSVGQRWGAKVSYPTLYRDQAEILSTWLLKLNGRSGTFFLNNPLTRLPQGNPSGTPLVNGANQTGQTLITDGWSNSASNLLLPGDFIEINERLYKVLSIVNSDSSGNADIDIWPRLRANIPDNASITTSNARGIFRLLENQSIAVDSIAGATYEFSFECAEAF